MICCNSAPILSHLSARHEIALEHLNPAARRHHSLSRFSIKSLPSSPAL
jgi:hypothetical protein